MLKWAFEGKLSESGFTGLENEQNKKPIKKSGKSINSENPENSINSDSDEEELPKGWKWAKLGSYLENISSGKSYRCNERPPEKGEIGIVKVSSVSWGFFDEMQSKTCFTNDLLNPKFLIKKARFSFQQSKYN